MYDYLYQINARNTISKMYVNAYKSNKCPLFGVFTQIPLKQGFKQQGSHMGLPLHIKTRIDTSNLEVVSWPGGFTQMLFP